MSHNWKFVEDGWNVVEDRASKIWKCAKCGSKLPHKRYRDAVVFLPEDIRYQVIQTIDEQAGVKMYSCNEIIALRVMVS